MKWSILLNLVAKGQVTARSIVRGPTTHQLWCVAAEVKGLSREFGLCYSCGGSIERTANQCPHCNKLQEPPVNPDVLLEMREPSRPTGQREQRPAPAPVSQFEPEELAVPAPPAPNVPKPPHRRPGESRPASEAGILSAKELATAFQLDFQPAPVPSPSAVKKRRRSLLGSLVLLALLVTVGAAVLLLLVPELRSSAITWLDEQLESAKTYASTAGQSANGETPPALGAAEPILEESWSANERSAREAEQIAQAVQRPAQPLPPPPVTQLPPAIQDPQEALDSPTESAVASVPPPDANDANGARSDSASGSDGGDAAAQAPDAPQTPEAVNPPLLAEDDHQEPVIAAAPQSEPVAQLRQPVHQSPPSEATRAEPEPEPVEAQSQRPAPQEPPAQQPEPAPPEAQPVPAMDDAALARKLFREALDAERKRDFPKAVELYQQIKKLPENVQQHGLDVRIANARARM